MRIDVHFEDRVGIAHEILAVLARRRLNLSAVEVEPPHIYIDIPALAETDLPALQSDLLAVPGTMTVTRLSVLPGVRRRLHLEALLAAMADPVLAVDGDQRIVACNAQALNVSHLSEHQLYGMNIGQLFDDAHLDQDLRDLSARGGAREVVLHGQSYMIDWSPVSDASASDVNRTVGAVITLHAPRRLGGRLHALQNTAEGDFSAIIGDSQVVRSLKARAARVALVDAPLLILGETGTGKELVAQACHAASLRSAAPFLALNCASMPENLVESELFGYAPGAFTGAQRSGKPGLIELAEGGTVFLDEVGEMSPYLQAKLLRFLNDGRFRRVGGDREIQAKVRIISATHRDLESMVAQGVFREDLYYRLNVLNLSVPPLRTRGADVLILARHFIERACTQAQRPHAKLTPEAESLLLAAHWPGNVRQLQNLMFRAVTMSDGPVIDIHDLDISEQGGHAEADTSGLDWEALVARFEKTVLEQLFPQFPSSRKLAARLNTSHSMIAAKLRRHGIARD